MGIVGVAGQDVNQTLGGKPLTPALGVATKAPEQRPGGDLQPGAGLGRLEKPRVVGFIQPVQPFGVGNQGDEIRLQRVLDLSQEARRNGMMGWLQEKVPAGGQGGIAPVAQGGKAFGREVDIRAGTDGQGDVVRPQFLAKTGHGGGNHGRGMGVEPRIDMRRADAVRDAVRDGNPRHGQGVFQRGGPVVHGRE